LDVVDNQHYITKWVEDNIINVVKETLNFDEKHTLSYEQGVKKLVEDAIQNGVRHIEIGWHQCNNIDDAIERGVKATITSELRSKLTAENIIENGVKETMFNQGHKQLTVKNIIENGVRDISQMTQYTDWQVEEIIENGVKETNHVDIMGFFDNKMEDTLQNGVKETKTIGKESPNYPKMVIDDIINNGVKETNHIKNNVRETKQFEEHLSGTIDEVIKEGVKETKTPGKDGDIMSTVEWMEENNSSSYTKMINDVIENGVKETKHANKYDSIGPVFKEGKIENVIVNGDKVSGTFVGGKRQKENIESVIGYGTKNPTD
jgi:hypothetical protein